MELAAVVDSDATQAQAVASQFGCSALATVEDLFGRVEAASVAVPTLHHRGTAAALMAAGIDVLIEKPLASTLEEADDLVSRAAKAKRVLAVGHIEVQVLDRLEAVGITLGHVVELNLGHDLSSPTGLRTARRLVPGILAG